MSRSLWLVLGLAVATVHAQTNVIQYAADSGSGTWRKIADPVKSNVGCRNLFTYALALCESKTYPDRLAKLFDLAAQMIDRDPKSKGYGNLRWYWNNTKVEDYNAVEFCMQAGTIIWIRHRDALPADARAKLTAILELATEGCRRHKVRTDYTNIALMNAANLILLGENLNKPDIATEGYKRLDEFVRYTFQNGIHEYCSPTYYGTDIGVLDGLERFAQRDRDRQIARALLQLFWTDIAANWLPGAERLCGTQSRTYDYLYGCGELDTPLWTEGWFTGPPRGGAAVIYYARANWHPRANLRNLPLPRLVHQSWGVSNAQYRTHYLLPDVTLSTSGAYYGGWMDMPLTVDLPGERGTSVRCYFIPDGRQDPYGKIKIPAGPHQKAHHLSAFFAGAQRTIDAAALVIYRDTDIPTNCVSLQTHFVMPKATDGFWIGGRKVELSPSTPLPPGEALVFRKGTAAVGIRVPWTSPGSTAALVWDGNKFGAVRLTITHTLTGTPGAALWVRIGSGLTNDGAFAKWHYAFFTAKAEVTGETQVRVAGVDGPVAVGAAAPYKTYTVMEPPPKRVVLEIDDTDVGRQLLKDLAPLK